MHTATANYNDLYMSCACITTGLQKLRIENETSDIR